jgi:hypothetical protein
MSDILPKPFTREGLLQLLEKHLPHLKKQTMIKDEENPLNALPSPNRTHTPSTTTWTTSSSPNVSQHDPTFGSLGGSVLDNPMFAAQTGLNPNGLAYVAAQPMTGHRRPLDLGDEGIGGGGKRVQMYGPIPGQMRR